MGVTGYEEHVPAEVGSEAYIVEVYDDGTRQRVSSVQDAYLAWLADGGQPVRVSDPAAPVEPTRPEEAPLAAFRVAMEDLAKYAREHPEKALELIEGMNDVAKKGGRSNAPNQ